MKKLIVIALAVVMMVSAVAVLAACGKTYEGDCHYTSYGHEYGCKVKVTVKGDTITKVVLLTDEETGYVRTSADNEAAGWTAHDETEAAYDAWLEEAFVGKTLTEVKAYKATATDKGQTVTSGPIIKLTKGENCSHATAQQSSARIIVAVQNAIKDL